MVSSSLSTRPHSFHHLPRSIVLYIIGFLGNWRSYVYARAQLTACNDTLRVFESDWWLAWRERLVWMRWRREHPMSPSACPSPPQYASATALARALLKAKEAPPSVRRLLCTHPTPRRWLVWLATGCADASLAPPLVLLDDAAVIARLRTITANVDAVRRMSARWRREVWGAP